MEFIITLLVYTIYYSLLINFLTKGNVSYVAKTQLMQDCNGLINGYLW